MAKRKGSDEEEEAGNPDGSDVMEVISAKDLKSLMRAKAANSKALDEVKIIFAEKMDTAKREKHLDPWAFRVCTQLDAMDPETMADKLPTLLYYLDASGLSERVKKVGRLPLDGEEQRAAPTLKGGKPADPPESSFGRKLRSVQGTAGDGFKTAEAAE